MQKKQQHSNAHFLFKCPLLSQIYQDSNSTVFYTNNYNVNLNKINLNTFDISFIGCITPANITKLCVSMEIKRHGKE